MIDIVVPDGDEKKFIRIAEKLGFNGLVFLYDRPKDLKELRATTRLKLYTACAKGRCDMTIIEAKDDARHLLEKTNVDVIYGIEKDEGRDHTHYRYSGMNQVLAKIAHDKGRIICIDISRVINSSGVKRAKIMGRMMQNIMLYRKYKVKVAAASFARSPYSMRDAGDMQALLRLMGMGAGDAKDALSIISNDTY